jgi:hypothetical protein
VQGCGFGSDGAFYATEFRATAGSASGTSTISALWDPGLPTATMLALRALDGISLP